MKPWAFCLPLLVLPVLWTSAESLRSPLAGEVAPDGPPVTVGLDQLALITLPPGSKFTKALEIEIAIPRDVFPYRSNLAVFIYQNYQPGKVAATADRIGIEVLPPAAKFYLEAPLVAKAGLRAAVDTAVLKVTKGEAAFPLAVVVLPIDKELPPGYEKFQFTVRSRLVHTNVGAINLLTPGLTDDDRKRLKVSANGLAQAAEGPILLEPGAYTLEVSLPGVDTVTLNAVVAQAKTTDVTVELVQEAPSVVIEAPEGTQVVIDGKRVAWKPQTAIPMDRGQHNVQFVVGNTVVADSFSIDEGGRHRLALKMAVALTRE